MNRLSTPGWEFSKQICSCFLEISISPRFRKSVNILKTRTKHATFRSPMPLMYLFSWYILYNHIFKLRTFNTIPEYQVVPGISGQCRSRRHYIGSILAVHVTTLDPYAQWPVGRTQYGIGASRVTSIKL